MIVISSDNSMSSPSEYSTATRSGDNGPFTILGLLRLLGKQDASAQEQRAAIANWLNENKPSKQLRVSLRANGFGLLLGRPASTDSSPGQE